VGTVVDANGRPILGASVAQGSDRHGSHYPETATDGNGAFRFSYGRPGEMVLTAQKTGYAPELKVLQVGEGLEPIEFVLGPGNAIRGKVVDADGNALAEIPITADGWRGHRSINWYSKTDAEGRFEWSSAPADEVLFDLYPRGYMSVRRFPMTPSDEEYVITMYGLLTVTGRVMDAETKEPIEEFQAMPGIKWSEEQAARWNRRDAKTFANGRYGITFDYPRYGHLVRVEADGYLPGISRVFKDDEGEQVFDFELEKGTGPSGTVLSPDGEPLSDATLALATPGQPVRISNGSISSRRDDFITAQSDANGRFSFPPQTDAFAIVALHDQGYAEISDEELQAEPDITLRHWASVKGKLFIGAGEGADEFVALLFEEAFYPNDAEPRIAWSFESQTDNKGNFVFEHVPGGQARVCRYVKIRRSSTYSHPVPVELKPGETFEVAIGGTGRPVIGRVVTPPDSGVEVNWSKSSSFNWLNLDVPPPETPEEVKEMPLEERRAWHQAWMQTDEYKAYRRARRGYALTLEPDGSFRVEDIPAGKYNLRIYAQEPSADGFPRGEMIGSLKHTFEVPEMPGGRSDEPLDLGTLELELRAK